MGERIGLEVEGKRNAECLISERRGNVFTEAIKVPDNKEWKDLAYSPCCG